MAAPEQETAKLQMLFPGLLCKASNESQFSVACAGGVIGRGLVAWGAVRPKTEQLPAKTSAGHGSLGHL